MGRYHTARRAIPMCPPRRICVYSQQGDAGECGGAGTDFTARRHTVTLSAAHS